MFFRGYFFRLLLIVVLGFLLIESWIYLTVSRSERGKIPKRYIRDYEAVLCDIPLPKTWVDNSTNPCPTKGIVTAFNHWGLFITMWQYANVIAASINTGMTPYLPFCMKNTLEKVFNELPLPILSDIGHCFLPLPESAKTLDAWTTSTQSIVIKTTDLFNDVVMEYLKVVREHFSFTSALKNFATSFLMAAKRNRTSATYIGVYITKTNIIVNQEYENIFASPQFFVDAMNYFRKKYRDAVFITITDRKGFWERFFKNTDVFVVNENSLTQFGSALAVLSHCNHTILATDEFAVWSAILTGGEAVVSTCLAEDFYALMQYQKNWTYLLRDKRNKKPVLREHSMIVAPRILNSSKTGRPQVDIIAMLLQGDQPLVSQIYSEASFGPWASLAFALISYLPIWVFDLKRSLM